MQFLFQTAISAEPVFSLNAILLSINQNLFDAIQHDDAFEAFVCAPSSNECFKL